MFLVLCMVLQAALYLESNAFVIIRSPISEQTSFEEADLGREIQGILFPESFEDELARQIDGMIEQLMKELEEEETRISQNEERIMFNSISGDAMIYEKYFIELLDGVQGSCDCSVDPMALKRLLEVVTLVLPTFEERNEFMVELIAEAKRKNFENPETTTEAKEVTTEAQEVTTEEKEVPIVIEISEDSDEKEIKEVESMEGEEQIKMIPEKQIAMDNEIPDSINEQEGIFKINQELIETDKNGGITRLNGIDNPYKMKKHYRPWAKSDSYYDEKGFMNDRPVEEQFQKKKVTNTEFGNRGNDRSKLISDFLSELDKETSGNTKYNVGPSYAVPSHTTEKSFWSKLFG